MEKNCYGRKEASERIGISLPTLDAFLNRSDNPLPHIRAGRKVIIPVSSLEAWLTAEAARTIGGSNDGPSL